MRCIISAESDASMSTLYIVATPIGNLQDISLRAIKTLFSAQVIACEDTRRTGLLLQQLTKLTNVPVEFKPRLISFYDEVEQRKIPEIIEILKSGLDVALVSDAGTPLVSDPGFKLVRECIEQGIRVESIPGASSVVTALTVSGLPSDKFFFFGYPPRKEGHRRELFEKLHTLQGQLKTTAIFFEAPHRIIGTIDELIETFGEDKHIVICRELTKIHEEVMRDTLGKMKQHFAHNNPKGEFVLLLNTEE